MYSSFILPPNFGPHHIPAIDYQLNTQNEPETNYKKDPLYKKLMERDLNVVKRYERILEPKGIRNNIKLLLEKNEKSKERLEKLLITKEVIAKKEEIQKNIETKL